jgi:hypothetical protein
MSKRLEIAVQPDFLERQAKAQPLNAIAELVWNALDADSTNIDVHFDSNALGLSAVRVVDNGHGIPYEEAPELFTKLGGSWKKHARCTRIKKRMLHGFEGRGRFKAFSLGRSIEWDTVYKKQDGTFGTYKISMLEDDISHVNISDEKATNSNSTGTSVTISELHQQFRTLDSNDSRQEMSELFALYMMNYRDISISYGSIRIDPGLVILNTKKIELSSVEGDGKQIAFELEVIEWKTGTSKNLYLCSTDGFPLLQAANRFQIGDFHFTAYLKSDFISQAHNENYLELAENQTPLNKKIIEAQEAIKNYFRARSAEDASTIVEGWKNENVYPFVGEAKSVIEKVERDVFNIVAIKVNDYLPEFTTSSTKNKAFHLRMLKQAIEKSPEDLQIILNEVLDLPKRKREEFAKLLKETSLSAIISASKLVADRLKFLSGLETLLFSPDLKPFLKERSQLHRMLADNTWLFGEEFTLSVDDQSLTEVLRKHKELLGEEIEIDAPVKHIAKKRGIIDLMLSRAIRNHRPNEFEHLIIELKAPRVKISAKEVVQIEQYAISVADDERFRDINVRWHFFVVSDDYDKYANFRMGENGMISGKDNMKIAVTTWSKIIEQNKARLQFFQEKLEHQVDKGTALAYVRKKYEQLLTNVVEDDEEKDEDSIEKENA